MLNAMKAGNPTYYTDRIRVISGLKDMYKIPY